MISDLPWLLALAAIGFVVVAIVLAAVRPLVVDRRTSTRLPTSTERERLTSGVAGAHRVRLRITGHSPDTAPARARALGILPGSQYVFVVDRLLVSLSTAAGRAAIAHEIGHHRGWHPLLRVVLPAVALIGWPIAIASGVPYALVGGAVALPLYVLLVCAIERKTEHLADEYAGKHVGYTAMRDALEYLEATSSNRRHSGLARLLTTRPSFVARIAHLEALARDENVDDGDSSGSE
ncbi:M48 family metalloprotease [Halococcus salifodinae]|uniref:Peptidase n=1 Tax=Halococcus salifodinae DSM 8989 TaxID=1227456 RepID=M0NC27_9EURY|nr:M48 family metalloprotease [Halococcus salifodinae]EMA54654.1 peptidase [Halococcus salifodinae DSM 8989]